LTQEVLEHQEVLQQRRFVADSAGIGARILLARRRACVMRCGHCVGAQVEAMRGSGLRYVGQSYAKKV